MLFRAASVAGTSSCQYRLCPDTVLKEPAVLQNAPNDLTKHCKMQGHTRVAATYVVRVSLWRRAGFCEILTALQRPHSHVHHTRAPRAGSFTPLTCLTLVTPHLAFFYAVSAYLRRPAGRPACTCCVLTAASYPWEPRRSSKPPSAPRQAPYAQRS